MDMRFLRVGRVSAFAKSMIAVARKPKFWLASQSQQGPE